MPHPREGAGGEALKMLKAVGVAWRGHAHILLDRISSHRRHQTTMFTPPASFTRSSCEPGNFNGTNPRAISSTIPFRSLIYCVECATPLKAGLSNPDRLSRPKAGASHGPLAVLWVFLQRLFWWYLPMLKFQLAVGQSTI